MKGKLIGDILVVKKVPEDIDEIVKLPYINRIIKIGHIHGQKREPEIEMIYGEGTRTIHKENYCKYAIDVAKVMWSKGNTGERLRMSKYQRIMKLLLICLQELDTLQFQWLYILIQKKYMQWKLIPILIIYYVRISS